MTKAFRTIVFFLAAAALLATVSIVQAATFSLEPASGTLIKGCPASINVKLNTGSQSSNGAQIYVDYTGVSSANMSGTGLFTSYGLPPGLPAGTAGLYGYGGVVSGASLNFGRINFTAGALGTVGLTIRFGGTDSLVSKVAAYPTSENILTSVVSGSYTIVNGYCETAPPYLVNLIPAPGTPNHPIDENIKFDIKDDGSGVNISSLVVTVQQNETDVPFNISTVLKSTTQGWYSVDIDPINNLIPELKVVVTVNVSDNAGNALSRSYYFNDLTCSQLGCAVGGAVAQCNDGIDNEGDGSVDFPSDSGCDSVDDNSEYVLGDIVCTQVISTSTSPVCPSPICVSGISSQCNDGVDNDNDNLIDMADPGCDSGDDNNEYVFGEVKCPICPSIITTPTITPPFISPTTTQQIFDVGDLKFFLASRTVETKASNLSVVEDLVGMSFAVGANIKDVQGPITGVYLVLGGKTYSMYFDNGLKMYVADVLDLNEVEILNGIVSVKHGTNQEDTAQFVLSVLTSGIVSSKDQDGKINPLPGATVVLEQLSSANKYIQIKTAITNNRGEYGFVLPNGSYRLKIDSEGYKNQITSGFTITNHIINRFFVMFPKVDLLSPDVSLGEKITYIGDVAGEQTNKIIESVNDPIVEQTAKTTVAPIALGAAVAATVPALSFLNLISYLRFLFLQPVFLFGRKKRKKWGIVYNALTKMPIDLALIRLLDVKTNKVIQSRVTDTEGRYAFFVDPGLYRLEVVKQSLMFPTKILQDFKEDTTFLDIYHGEAIHVDEKYTAIAANIPMDPVGVEEKTPRRIIWSQRLRDLQSFIASLSIVAGLVALIISPTWWTIGLFVFQIAIYYLFKRLSSAKKPKSWGIVYEKTNNQPVDRAMARLFSKQFNKLVASELTDNNGRYAFMVGPNDYYITFEKTGYQKKTTPDIKIKERNEIIKVNVAMDRDESSKPISTTSNPVPPVKN
ncbi:MAG: hypothetical protein COU29_02255 [Candidatus Magasanikbacteria bacterium CG10_big_fil_rev_8_21_14_0_10_36_32]|uniref:Carboxypeptidase regulatory-like domain-containing protein n=1 Tax=Candidatus Magasanikbacteria bacterium CG10_big_fil_rev_8_21_14_0_10_36_32 TaxID=1974646 RepID=A0A2M6W705_9BACT|nr:MAG: hypothetical protein COU29_02255 [Candidatus Magasanikbacteria bacterium CG10_big_fil_rev_8_21_14_0_10_36_32]